MTKRYRSDAIVVGGGLAGICAALELLDAGLAVLLLDRDAPEAFGGLARESFGGILVVGSREQARVGMRDSPELALADWASFAEFEPGDEWPRRWAEAYVHRCRAEVYEWLRAHGVGFLPIPHWVERGGRQRGNSVPRFHIVWGTGQWLADRLIAALREHRNAARLELAFGHRVERLVANGGAVAGCAGALEADGSPFEAEAPAVVVCAGGINGSDERVRAHWHPDWGRPPETILAGSHRYADGALHDAVSAVGGRVTHLDRMWNYAAGVHHWRPRKPNHGLSLVPPRSALWLDPRGHRILPPMVTGYDTRELVAEVCRQSPQHTWQLLNRRIAAKELAVSGAEFNRSIRDRRPLAFVRDLLLGNPSLVDEMVRDCDDFVSARSLPELVERMNALQREPAVELEAVQRAVAAFDAELDLPPERRTDPQRLKIAELRRYRGDRVRTCAAQKILDPAAGPLIAIREFVISRKTLGGIQTDLSSRVLDATGTPIPGLFAAGESAGFGGGGMNGLRALEGTFLGGCILGGRIAGRAIAGRA